MRRVIICSNSKILQGFDEFYFTHITDIWFHDQCLPWDSLCDQTRNHSLNSFFDITKLQLCWSKDNDYKNSNISSKKFINLVLNYHFNKLKQQYWISPNNTVSKEKSHRLTLSVTTFIERRINKFRIKHRMPFQI